MAASARRLQNSQAEMDGLLVKVESEFKTFREHADASITADANFENIRNEIVDGGHQIYKKLYIVVEEKTKL